MLPNPAATATFKKLRLSIFLASSVSGCWFQRPGMFVWASGAGRPLRRERRGEGGGHRGDCAPQRHRERGVSERKIFDFRDSGNAICDFRAAVFLRRERRGEWRATEGIVTPQRHRERGVSERKIFEFPRLRQRYLRAAAAPFFPKAVRTFFGRWAMVRFSLAAVAAFLMFFRAAVFCFSVLMAFVFFRGKDLRRSVRLTIGIAGRVFGSRPL